MPSFLKSSQAMAADHAATMALPMPLLDRLQNWLRWVDADGYRMDSERQDARSMLAMVVACPDLALPNQLAAADGVVDDPGLKP